MYRGCCPNADCSHSDTFAALSFIKAPSCQKRVAEVRYSKIVSEIIDGSYFDNQKAKTVTVTIILKV
jgi:hypothetical protein